MEFNLGRDCFLIPYGEEYIVYIPTVSFIAGVKRNIGEEIISKYPSVDTVSGDSAVWIEAIKKMSRVELKYNEKHSVFKPTSVTLSLTSRCQLRCIYCYANGGENIRDMSNELVEDSINVIIKNAVDKKEKGIKVSFHGEGEPTANWNLFQRAIEYSKKKAMEHGIDVGYTMSTNGIWTDIQREYISKHFKNLSISMDGIDDVQNIQRPLANGDKSYSIVLDSIKYLENKGVDVGIRSTILESSIPKMKSFIDLISSSTKCKWLHFEPMFNTGRGIDLRVSNRYYDDFIQSYLECADYGRIKGIKIAYSGCKDKNFSYHFCNATGEDLNFFISTNGNVSSCYEVSDFSHMQSCRFIYGKYDTNSRTFIFDNEKLRALISSSVFDYQACNNCFAKYHCAGDCLMRSSQYDKESDRTKRCKINKELTLRELVCRVYNEL